MRRLRASAFLRAPLFSIFFLILSPLSYATPSPASDTGNYDALVSEEWMNILFNGRKIGFSYQKIEKGQAGYRITDRAVIRMKIMEITQDLSFSNVSHLDADKRLRRFVYLQTIQNQRQRTIGVREGGALRLTITGAGGTRTETVKIDNETRFADAVEFSLAEKLKVGLKVTVPIFITALRATETLTMEVIGQKTIEIGGEELEVFVIESALQGVKTHSFVTADGVKVREESFMGFTAVRVQEQQALAFTQAYVPITSLITFSLITPDKPIGNAAAVRELKLAIGGLDRPDLLPKDERQTVGEPERVFDEKRRRTFTLPVTIRSVEPRENISVAEASAAKPADLEPTPEIQSDNRMIMRQARRIIGAERDAWKAARMINQWVYKNVRKKFVDSFTAMDVLLSREGECQSHTNLFTALARSAGIPTRVAAGLVYSQSHGGFLYHAWPEVYVGDWIAVDPTLGQDVADATHIKLIGGEIENQIKLVRYIGRISISIDSVTTR